MKQVNIAFALNVSGLGGWDAAKTKLMQNRLEAMTAKAGNIVLADPVLPIEVQQENGDRNRKPRNRHERRKAMALWGRK